MASSIVPKSPKACRSGRRKHLIVKARQVAAFVKQRLLLRRRIGE